MLSAPLFFISAVTFIVGVLDASFALEAPHVTTSALGDLHAGVFGAAHVKLARALAATLSPPDLVAIAVRDDTLGTALRPLSLIAAVDLGAAGRLPVVTEPSLAHASVAIN